MTGWAERQRKAFQGRLALASENIRLAQHLRLSGGTARIGLGLSAMDRLSDPSDGR
jgi:hypothetical protein